MPNIIYKWDFEDGTTQGWTLGSNTVLDDTGAVQGTYSLKVSYTNSTYGGSYDFLIGSINNIDLSTTTKPLLLFTFKDASSAYCINYPNETEIIVKDATNTYVDVTLRLSHNIMNYSRIVLVDISSAAGKTGLTIEIHDKGAYYCSSIGYTGVHYYDNIAIIDGADYEYTVAILGNNNEDRTITIDVPDSDISTLSATVMALSLATAPWFSESGDTIQFTATNDQGSLTLTNTDDRTKHTNYASYTNALSLFSQAQVHIKPVNYTDNTHYNEEVAVVFADSSFNYKAVYLFDLYFTINPISPKFATVLHTTTYGNTVSGQKDYTININANSLDVAFKVSYLVGDSSLVQTGSVTMEVWDSSLSTQYGNTQVDLTTGNIITSSYVTGVPTNTDVVLRFKWSITASARVVLMVTPIFRVS